MSTQDTARTELVGLTIVSSAGVRAGANQSQIDNARGWLVIKAAGSPSHQEAKMPEPVEKDGQVTITKADYDALLAKAGAAPAAADPVAKAIEALPEEVRKAVEAQMADAVAKVEKAQADAAAAVAKAEAAESARLDREYVAKAQAEFSTLPCTADELGPVLRSIDTLLPDTPVTKADGTPGESQRALAKRLLKAAAEQATFVEMTKSVGNGAARTVTGGALAKVQKAAEALVAANPTMSVDAAVDQVLTNDAALAAEYVAERG